MAAPVIADYITALDNLISLRPNLNLDRPRMDLYQQSVRTLVTRIQELADGGDATAQSYLNTKRAFIKNVSGSNWIVPYNGQNFTFTNGSVYCCDPDEKRFFLAYDPNLTGSQLTSATLAEWLATTTIQAFYW